MSIKIIKESFGKWAVHIKKIDGFSGKEAIGSYEFWINPSIKGAGASQTIPISPSPPSPSVHQLECPVAAGLVWGLTIVFLIFFFLFLSFSKIMLKWTLSISCVRSSLYLFTPKSWNFPVFAGLIKLYKTTVSYMAFLFLFSRLFILWLHSLFHSWQSWGKNTLTTLHHSLPQLSPPQFLGKVFYFFPFYFHDERLNILLFIFTKPQTYIQNSLVLKIWTSLSQRLWFKFRRKIFESVPFQRKLGHKLKGYLATLQLI